jgi:N-sulfoglucosamine sulfohydrolase
VRTSRWKYIRRFVDRDTLAMSNVDDSPSKELWLNHGWHKRRVGEEYLFDLVFDPNEACNPGEPGYSPILDDMRNRMGEGMRRMDDPLLSGHVPAPSGQPLPILIH